MLEILSNIRPEQFFIQVVAMSLTALLLPKLRITSIFGPILTVLALAGINVLYWDAELFNIIPQSFSIKILQLLVINGVLFWLIVKLLPGIEVDGVLTAFIAPILFSLLSIAIEQYGPMVPWSDILGSTLNFISEMKQKLSSTPPEQTSALFKFSHLT